MTQTQPDDSCSLCQRARLHQPHLWEPNAPTDYESCMFEEMVSSTERDHEETSEVM